MKLCRFGRELDERPGLIDAEGRIRDLSSLVADISGNVLGPAVIARLRGVNPNSLPLVPEGTRLGAAVGGVGKFICVGLNYSDHAEESGLAKPVEPVLFMKATTSICGPDDDVIMPPGAQKMDWEVELGVVIGKRAKAVSQQDALSHVAGYLIVHDVSERSFQLERGGQWVKGKSYDRFGPIGPWLVTADEVGDPQKLALTLSVNDVVYQRGTTANMIFPVAHLIAHISEFMTLEPGDIITTGTPAGVGLGQKPPRYLKDGDVVKLWIDGLGAQRQVFKSAFAHSGTVCAA